MDCHHPTRYHLIHHRKLKSSGQRRRLLISAVGILVSLNQLPFVCELIARDRLLWVSSSHSVYPSRGAASGGKAAVQCSNLEIHQPERPLFPTAVTQRRALRGRSRPIPAARNPIWSPTNLNTYLRLRDQPKGLESRPFSGTPPAIRASCAHWPRRDDS